MAKWPFTVRPRTSYLIAVCGLFVVAVLAARIAVVIGDLHSRALAARERELQNIGLALAEQTDHTFEALDLVARSVSEHLGALGIKTSDDFRRELSSQDAHVRLRQKVREVPRLEAVALFDRNGELVNFSRSWPVPTLSIAQQDHFRAFLSDPRLILFVSRPFQNQTAVGTWNLALLRRVVGQDGEFLGLIASEISVQYFEEIFRRISLGQQSIISLIRSDGARLVRYPQLDDPLNPFHEHGSFKETLAHADQGAIRVKGPADGIERLVSVRSVAQYPVVVTVGATISDSLAEWRIEAIYIMRGGVLVALVIIAAMLLGVRQLDDHDRRQKIVVETALDNISQGLCMFDSTGRLMLCNQQYLRMYGLTPEQAKPGLSLREIINNRKEIGAFVGDPERYCSDLIAQVASGKAGSRSVDTVDGRTIQVITRPMKDGGWVTTHYDVTERRRAERERDRNRELIARLAHYDSLTGLANRALFYEELDRVFPRVQQGERIAILYIDLDQFKRVNDTLGHSVGDALLKSIGDRLRDCVREGDLVARLGGDEFAVLQCSVHAASDAGALAERIRAVIGAAHDLGGREIVTDASIGISMAPDDTTDRDQLLTNADLALYAAKAGGRGRYCFYNRDMSARMKARQELERDLRQALSRNQFELHYQPIVDARSNRVSGCEALLRWHDSERGWVAPSEIIPVAEESGLIVELGEWALRQACQDAAKWPEDKRVAVNVSAAQLTGGKLFLTVLGALAESGLPASRLELEITETVLMQGTEEALSTLHRLHELGVRIAMDDFGMGYSSLSYLRNFPFDAIKIDRSFVKGVLNDDDCVAIVRAVASLAESLGMTTTAEGIETEQQRQKLRDLGCTEMQGYLFSPPRPVVEIVRLFLSRVARIADAA